MTPFPPSFLSIGIAAGGTERFICEELPVGALFVIDDGASPTHCYWTQNKQMIIQSSKCPTPLVREYIGDSHSIDAAAFVKSLDRSFDLIGIDGDHTAAGVLADWRLVQPFLAPDALIWFHDICLNREGETGATELWSELRRRHRVVLETDVFGIGLIEFRRN